MIYYSTLQSTYNTFLCFSEIDKIKASACRTTCDTASAYASGLCASLSAFGAPLVCLATGITGLGCATAQGTLWAFGGYCTSSKILAQFLHIQRSNFKLKLQVTYGEAAHFTQNYDF